jgi:Spy/CpxP family protein refolding chaperone
MRLLPILLLAAAPALAQPHQHQHHHAPPAAAPAQPYAGLERRAIKALSAQQVEDLRAGRGMALALAAELNGYPGPMHVLDHADALRLTPQQRGRAEALRHAMSAEARTIGARIVSLEEELDALFAGGEADAGRLAALTAALGGLQGRLREVHLATHIAMRDALTPDQRRAYARLRGYASN